MSRVSECKEVSFSRKGQRLTSGKEIAWASIVHYSTKYRLEFVSPSSDLNHNFISNII